MAFLWPILDGPAPSGLQLYGTKRGTGKHAGCDIAAPAGTPVLSPVDGVVIRVVSGRLPGQAWNVGPSPLRDWVSGNGVIVKATNGLYVLVNHVAPAVHPGQRITRGTVLGHLDRSGIQTGPHLHIEFHRGYPTGLTHFDPMTLLDPKETDMALDATDKEWFTAELDARVGRVTDLGKEWQHKEGLEHVLILLRQSKAREQATLTAVQALAEAKGADPDEILAAFTELLEKKLSTLTISFD